MLMDCLQIQNALEKIVESNTALAAKVAGHGNSPAISRRAANIWNKRAAMLLALQESYRLGEMPRRIPITTKGGN